MFKRKKKIELSNEELRIILYSLTNFRNALLKENKYADSINEIIAKLKNKMKVHKYGFVFYPSLFLLTLAKQIHK